jgi:hypothetical protein
MASTKGTKKTTGKKAGKKATKAMKMTCGELMELFQKKRGKLSYLEKMVNGICDHYDEWLDKKYRWPLNCKGKDEKETVEDFNGYSTRLRKGEIDSSISDIFIWGGRFGKGIKSQQKQFSTAIKKLNKREDEPCPKEILDLGNKDGRIRIAFWSKVLAAYKPGEYYIYDSRVALALSYISLKVGVPCVWDIPNARGKPLKERRFEEFPDKSIADAIRDSLTGELREMRTDSNSCYPLYLKLLELLAAKGEIKRRYNGLPRETKAAYEKMFGKDEQKSIMAHLEKMLFMMKESILV